MDTPEAFVARLRDRPFRPFDVVSFDGERHEVRDPDTVRVGRRDFLIGYGEEPTPWFYTRLVRVAHEHIVSVVDVPGER